MGAVPASPAASPTAASPTAPTPRPKPRTVADDIADAKAKAAAEAAAAASAKGITPATAPSAAPQPSPAAAEKLADKHAGAHADKPLDKPHAPTPVAKAPDKALAAKPAVPNKTAHTADKAAEKAAADDGLAKVAVKLVAAMAAVQAKQDKQDKREIPRSQVKKTATKASDHEHMPAKAAEPEGHGPSGHDSSASGGHDEPHWTYEGDTGPANWAKLKPEFNACAIGKRQSPIAIDNTSTLQGPAEPIAFDYRASGGTVVNNGHTIQVDLTPDNGLVVRGSSYQLLQFHFHHPSEEQVNGKTFPMVAHLVHKNSDGQLAVVAVLLTAGAANPVIETVWKHMPLDANDRVRLPGALLNLNELLPKDQRYYQFMGSLTTPPCTEGVLWMVLKTPVTLSASQIRLFGQLFPNNARPVQGVNGRPVREAL